MQGFRGMRFGVPNKAVPAASSCMAYFRFVVNELAMNRIRDRQAFHYVGSAAVLMLG